jgi:hypothetical protein
MERRDTDGLETAWRSHQVIVTSTASVVRQNFMTLLLINVLGTAPPFKRRELPEALPIVIWRVWADFVSWTGVSSCQKTAISLARARLAATGAG